jgi:hypothetical protein
MTGKSFQREELARLRKHALQQWAVLGHVLPYELAGESLQEDIRASALEYFMRHQVKWWTSRWDKRSQGMAPRPTGHLNSSQTACVNHLEPARVDAQVARQIVATIEPLFSPTSVEDGLVDYEWIGRESYLGERGPRTRGANITSLDAVMCAERDGTRTLLAFEWKYLESYGLGSVATSSRGTDRVATYRALLERDDCPIRVRDIRFLFYEPYYQLMRQTLLAWQMVEHGEFGATDWLHIHVVPEKNVALRNSKAAPDLCGETMRDKWQSVMKQPERYRLLSASELLAGVGETGRWAPWRQWIRVRYLT